MKKLNGWMLACRSSLFEHATFYIKEQLIDNNFTMNLWIASWKYQNSLRNILCHNIISHLFFFFCFFQQNTYIEDVYTSDILKTKLAHDISCNTRTHALSVR